jgi:hypothetical protein
MPSEAASTVRQWIFGGTFERWCNVIHLKHRDDSKKRLMIAELTLREIKKLLLTAEFLPKGAYKSFCSLESSC